MSQSTKEANDSGNKTEASSKKRDYFFSGGRFGQEQLLVAIEAFDSFESGSKTRVATRRNE